MCNQPLLATWIDSHDCGGDPGLGLQCRFDLAQFHSMTANLQLLIGAPEKFEASIVAPADTITGSIESPFASDAGGIGHERFRRQCGIAAIPTGNPGAPEVKFPLDARGGQSARLIEHERQGLHQRATDWKRRVVFEIGACDVVAGRKGCALGWPIAVDQSGLGAQDAAGAANMRWREGLALSALVASPAADRAARRQLC